MRRFRRRWRGGARPGPRGGCGCAGVGCGSFAVLVFALVAPALPNIVPTLISAAGRTGTPGSTIAFVVSFGYAGYLASPPVLGFIESQTSVAAMFAVLAARCPAV